MIKNNKKFIFLALILIGILVVSFLTTLFLMREKPALPSRATETMCLATSFCSWSSDDTATSFNVKIKDQTTNTVVLEKTTSEKKVYFTPIAGHTYKCFVTSVNSCGPGDETSSTSTCQLITGTPSPTLTPSETPTPTPTGEITSTPTATPTITPTPEFSVTPGPSLTPTLTLTPTKTLTPTPKTSATPIPVACGTKSCDNTTNPCRSGLNCVQANDGSNYCSLPEFEEACKENPTQQSCCTAPGNSPTPTTESTNPPITQQAAATEQPEAPTIPASGNPANWLYYFIPAAILLLGLVF